MQWAIGDWYNAIPHGDKKAACERAGLNYKLASNYGAIGAQFPLSTRSGIIPFTCYKVLSIQELNQNQRADLLAKSSQNSWTTATLVRERDKLLGKPERVPVQNFNDQVQAVLE